MLKHKLVNIAGNLILACASVFLVLIGFEFSYRWLSSRELEQKTWAVTDKNHVPRPYVMAVGKPGSFVGNDTHNLLGYRGALPIIPKPKDEIRVIILGGSTVHLGSANIANLITQFAGEAVGNKKIVVYNFGSTSSISRQDLVRLITDVTGYSPDIVLHYGWSNEFYNEVEKRVNYPHRFFFYEQYQANLQDIHRYSLLNALLLASQFYRDHLFTTRIDEAITGFTSAPADQNHQLRILAYLQNIQKMREWSDAHGIRFYPIAGPLIAYKLEAGNEAEQEILHDAELTKQARADRDTILRFMTVHNYAPIDCTHIFDKVSAGVFRRGDHINNLYLAKHAKCIARGLQSKAREVSIKPLIKMPEVPEHIYQTGFEHRSDLDSMIFENDQKSK